jgi:hypothetical protein
MTDTTYLYRQTVIASPWLQDVNNFIYRPLGSVAALRLQVATPLPSTNPVPGPQWWFVKGVGTYWANLADTTSADNGLSIIVGNDGTRWYLAAPPTIIGGPISVDYYVGSATGDVTSRIQTALNSNPWVTFTPGKTYTVGTNGTGLTVPQTCYRIDGDGAFLTGPGQFTSIDAFTFSNWYQGGGSIPVKSELYRLPSAKYFRYGVNLTDAAFLRIYMDTMEYMQGGFFSQCTASGLYCFELELEARFMWHLYNSGRTAGGAYWMYASGTSSAAFQGNRCRAFYVDDVFAGVYEQFDGTGNAGNINNQYHLGEVDQSDYVKYATLPGMSSQQNYSVPMGITSPVTSVSNGQPFYNWSSGDTFNVLGINGNDPTILAATNFQLNGCGNRIGIQTYTAAGGAAPILWVNSATGSDTTGTGANAAPFASIARAIAAYQNIDLFGKTAYVYVQDGTYTAGGLYNALGGSGCNGTIAIVGDPANPQNCVMNIGGVAFSCNGSGANMLISGFTINGGVLAQSGGQLSIGPDVVFGAWSGGTHISAQNAGQIYLNSNYSVTGAAGQHMQASGSGSGIYANGVSAVTCTGTFSFANEFAFATQGGLLSVPSVTYTGTGVSGTRYLASVGGIIFTNSGASTTYFPGTVAGSTNTGGVYT